MYTLWIQAFSWKETRTLHLTLHSESDETMERRPLYTSLDVPQARMTYAARPNPEMPDLSERNLGWEKPWAPTQDMIQSPGGPMWGYPYNHNLNKGYPFDTNPLKERDATLMSTLPGIYEDAQTPPGNMNRTGTSYQQLSRERALSEKLHQMQRVEDLQATILTLDEERSQYMNRQSRMEADMVGMEEEIRSLGCKLQASEEELKKAKTECTSLRQLKSKTESALGDSQRNLIAKIRELRNVQDRNKQLEERNGSLLKQVNGLTEEARPLQYKVSELNQDKDDLQRQLEDKEKTIETQRLKIEELEKSAESLQQAVSGGEWQLQNLQRNLANAEAELEAVKKDKEAMLESNVHLRADLDKLCLDNKALLSKMEGYSQEMEALQSKIQDYATESSCTSELMSTKENVIQRLQLTVEELEASAESLRQVVNRRHLELAAMRSKMSDMEGTLETVMGEKDAVLESNCHLRDKLEKAYLENQALLCKLEESRQDMEVLQRNLQDYVTETSCTNQLLSSDEGVIERLQLTVKELESSAGSLQQAVRGRDQELEAIKKNMASTEAELRAVMMEKESLLETNTQLIAELDKAYLDVQALQHRLQESSQEVEVLQRRLQECDVATKEDQTSSKDQLKENLKLTPGGLEQSAEGLQGVGNRGERELEALQTKLEETEKNLETMMREKEAILQTNIHLRANLEKAYLDNKVLQDKVEESNQDMKDLHRELLEFNTEFSGFENCLSSSEEVIGRLQLTFEGLEMSANSLRDVVHSTDLEQGRPVKEGEGSPQKKQAVSL
ncbi:hypothetical protein MATL_G00176460 [Megalops atlanticus]|uniref:Uncharacterized protein n=1 Tax=Megalops atlanticus TaxID=7932 RepID=A0A9D3T096_MEGAT|nr:hypothetical protein MATL_G00176460 [Megalops atlanticus]